MQVLQETGERGYPTEYLLSRIRGRRSQFFRDWDTVDASTGTLGHMPARYRDYIARYSYEGIWKRYRKELKWLYFQMNGKVRRVFLPYLLYSELDILLVCLRYSAGQGSRAETEGLLSYSLLSEKIKNVLRSDAGLPLILGMLRKQSPFLRTAVPDISGGPGKNGLTEVEQWITVSLLDYIMDMELHPVMMYFMKLIIDVKNILSLHKYLRWDIPSAPALFKGGTISPELLHRTGQSGNLSGLEDLIRRYTGVSTSGRHTSPGIEGMLYRHVTARVKKLEHQGGEAGLILGYVWRFYREARNFSILTYGQNVDRHALKQELVY